MMSKTLTNIFIRSLFIHSALNYPRMQNLGFCFALLPVLKVLGLNREGQAAFMKRHLQAFNTHPYLSGAIIGSVVREELQAKGCDGDATMRLKGTFMAPYAAMGDPLFGGALKPFCSTLGVLFAFTGFLLTPLAYFFLFNPLHLWVRVRVFLAGYREGNGALNLIGRMNMPGLTAFIRLLSLVAAGLLAAYVLHLFRGEMDAGMMGLAAATLLGPAFILVCYRLLKAGVSQTLILYALSVIILLGSWFVC